MYDRLDVIRDHVSGWTVRDFERISMNFDNKILPSLNKLIQERFMLRITIQDKTIRVHEIHSDIHTKLGEIHSEMQLFKFQAFANCEAVWFRVKLAERKVVSFEKGIFDSVSRLINENILPDLTIKIRRLLHHKEISEGEYNEIMEYNKNGEITKRRIREAATKFSQSSLASTSPFAYSFLTSGRMKNEVQLHEHLIQSPSPSWAIESRQMIHPEDLVLNSEQQDLRDESSAMIQSPTNHSTTTIMDTTLVDSVTSSAVLINHHDHQKEQAPSSSIMLNTSISPITLTEESITKTMQLVPVIGARRRGKLTKTKTNNHTIHSQFEDEEEFDEDYFRMDDEEDEHRLQSSTSSQTQNEDQLKDHDLTIAKRSDIRTKTEEFIERLNKSPSMQQIVEETESALVNSIKAIMVEEDKIRDQVYKLVLATCNELRESYEHEEEQEVTATEKKIVYASLIRVLIVMLDRICKYTFLSIILMCF